MAASATGRWCLRWRGSASRRSAVPTVILPYHPGHGPAEKIAIEDKAFSALLKTACQRSGAGGIVGCISGYLASAGQADAVAEAVGTLKAARPEAIYLCDPVIGDEGRLYVGDSLAAAIRDKLLSLADIATPNAFECAWLAGDPSAAEPDLAALARHLPPPATLVTSVPALMRGAVANLLVTPRETILFEHPRLTTPVKGTGDLLAALLLARRLQGYDWRLAVEMALSSVFEVVAGSAKAGSDELMLPALQDSLVRPHAPINVRNLRQ